MKLLKLKAKQSMLLVKAMEPLMVLEKKEIKVEILLYRINAISQSQVEDIYRSGRETPTLPEKMLTDS